MDPMPMFLAAIYEGEHEQEVQMNPPDEQLNRNAPGLSTAERQSEDWNWQGHTERGTVAERPTEIPPKHIPDDMHIDEESHDAVQFGASEGEYQ
jgi:hypothetical protein